VSASLLSDDALPTSAELRDFTDWRRAVCGEAAAFAAAHCRASGKRALAAAEALAAERTGDPHDYRLADSALHLRIAEISQSARLIAAEAQIQIELSEMLRTIPRPAVALAASHQQHLPILQAIYDGNGDRTRALATEHVEGTFDWLRGLRLGQFKN
jgi:GntR family transcriptional repressor for pyruvate dehydrogenase complex